MSFAAGKKGPDIEISFQARLITEALKALDDRDEVSMAFTSGDRDRWSSAFRGKIDYLYLLDACPGLDGEIGLEL